MSETPISKQQQHTAGPQILGADYQFYYFMYLAVGLKTGQKVGFEVKDDLHIDNPDGTTVLIQAKHSIATKANGEAANLTTFDSDLWKTLSNWTEFIKAGDDSNDFIEKHTFILVTNKNEHSNEFINCHSDFMADGDIDKVIDTLKEFKGRTKDKELKKYIANVGSLSKKKLKRFFQKLSLETGVDEIIGQVKNRIHENVKQEKYVEPVFDSLFSNLSITKYFDIRGRKNFEITQEEFNKKFGKCFQSAFERAVLPSRNVPIQLPENLEDQVFIKQLIDIGEVEPGSDDIRDYTTQMLKFFNDFTFWTKDHLLPTAIQSFNEESILIWKNEFKAKYNSIKNKIAAGTSMDDLEDEIKNLGLELVYHIRRQDLCIPGHFPLGIGPSNGHYYLLSNKLEIGWHYDWKNKYKKE
ncbi:hypothetical protein BAY13_17085 [Elizabethkingia bruuniana]|uniref:hypothetical protein n=1 Tax=Elizabethkingia bruuniana TaxID=1756149 RepID=UPI00099B0395|nr:hypothetical protein [Elizabethkingia bruuniana]OPC66450.1 hypothetical protein BAY13_17085 [Elizabethkingia bruuniana]